MMINKFFWLLVHPKKMLLTILVRFGENINDELYLKLRYRLIMNRKLNLENPKTYNEKLQWLKLYDRNPLYTNMVDKFEVKKYVEKEIGSQYIIKTLGVWDKFSDIDFDQLPNQFVLKCTHDSGGVFICKNKNELEINIPRAVFKKALNKRFYKFNREYVYGGVTPRIIAEEFKVDESGEELKDYKFFCFSGEPKLMFIATGRPHDTRFDFYDLEFNHLNIVNGYPNSDKINFKPQGFDTMVELARKLSKGIPHVRVDFYDINGQVFFGEMTFFHFSGSVPFKPEEWDLKLGEMIKLPID